MRSELHLRNWWFKHSNTEENAIDNVFRLLDIPWWYYAIAVLLGVVVIWVWKRPSLGLLTGYGLLLLAETVLIRKPFIGEHLRLEPFWSWRAWDKQREQILTNIVMFIPVGVLAGRAWKWKGALVALSMSITVELLQLLTQRGLCELDDVMHNMIGAVIGIGIAMMAGLIRKREL